MADSRIKDLLLVKVKADLDGTEKFAVDKTGDAGASQLALSEIAGYVNDALKASVPSAGDTLNKLYNLIVGIGQFAGAHDASGGLLPTVGTGALGAIDKSDYWKVSVAGTIAGLGTFKSGDVIYASIAGASIAADFFAVENNQDQATSSVLGLAKLYTDATASNTDGAVNQAVAKTIKDIADANTAAIALKKNISDTASALTSGSSIAITGLKHTLSTALTAITFTISYIGDEIKLDVILNTTGAIFTFPATALCISEGIASGDNNLTLAGASGDLYRIGIEKTASGYVVAGKNFGQ